MVHSSPAGGATSCDVTSAEVLYSVRDEMAVHLSDVDVAPHRSRLGGVSRPRGARADCRRHGG